MKKYFILAAAALALGACSNDEGSNVANDGAINLTTEMRGGTRALDQDIQATQIANGKSVWVEFTSSDTPTEALNSGSPAGPWDATNKKATVAYTANGSGNLSTTTPVKWPVVYSSSTGTTVEIKAWAPYTKITAVPTAGTTTFAVEADQSTDANYIASDYLYGTAAAFNHDAIANPVLVKFDHMLAKINVNLFTTKADIDLTGATVTFNGTQLTGTIQADGSVTVPTTPSGTATPITMTSSLAKSGTDFSCSAIIIPQTITASSSSPVELFTITLAGGTPPTTKKYELKVNKTYQAKNVYNYNITINDSETIILSEQINPWITSSSNNESIIAN